MSVEDNRTLVRRFLEEVWNEGRLDLLDEFIADGATLTFRGETSPPGGPAAVRGVVAWWRAAFPDFRFEVADLIAEGDKVVARVPFTGTHLGQWMELAPTGRAVRVGEMLILRIVDGKIAEGWEEYDEWDLRRQLTAPETAPASAAG